MYTCRVDVTNRYVPSDSIKEGPSLVRNLNGKDLYVADRGLYFGGVDDLERQYGHRLSVSGAMDEGRLLVRGAATQLLADEDDMSVPTPYYDDGKGIVIYNGVDIDVRPMIDCPNETRSKARI